LFSPYWFSPLVPDPETKNISCFENTAVFEVANFQYLIVAFIFIDGKPFRQPIYKNYLYIGVIIILECLCIVIVFRAPDFLISFLELTIFPSHFQWLIFLLSVINFIVSIVYERIFIRLADRYRKKLYYMPFLKQRKKIKPYKQIIKQLESSLLFHSDKKI